MTKRAYLVAAGVVVLVVTAVAAALFATSNGEPTVAVSEPDPLYMRVVLITENGMIGANHDDVQCVWREPSWVLRDEAGKIVATGKPRTDGAEAGGHPAAVGEVVSERPDYRCELAFDVRAEARDFYELEATVAGLAGGKRTAEATFDYDEIGPVELEFS